MARDIPAEITAAEVIAAVITNGNCIAEHELSLYVETEKHKLLLDTGQTDAVAKNAKVLGIDLSAVDKRLKTAPAIV